MLTEITKKKINAIKPQETDQDLAQLRNDQILEKQ